MGQFKRKENIRNILISESVALYASDEQIDLHLCLFSSDYGFCVRKDVSGDHMRLTAINDRTLG